MFIHYRTEGIIIKKEEKGEADLLFTVFTKDFGKMKILGKSVRKISSKLRPATGIFSFSGIEFIQGKAQKILTDAVLIGKSPELAKDLKKLRIAHKIAEVLDKLIKGQEYDEEIWKLLTKTFQKLGSPLIFHYFFWNLIAILGYQPELYHCVYCHKKIAQEKNYFSRKEGGIICQKCSLGNNLELEIKPETIKILRIILKKDWATLLKLKFEAQYLKELSSCAKLQFI
ncbi:MAG: DNA repair protein RecO [Candidatus Nealsonbacteria bacterium]|nr:DNA repair protein RecO [Candidatus Nealsonbacteria bacterium]